MRRMFWTWVMVAGCVAVAAPLLPRPTGYVVDDAQMLSPGARQQLERLATDLEKDTSVELAIVTMASLEGETPDGYAQRLFQSWGIGKKEKNNGILLLLAQQERQVRIQTGYGVEGLLPDGLCGEIIRTRMVPFFRRGDFPGGLMEGAQAVALVIRQDPSAPKMPHESGRGRRDVNVKGALVQLAIFAFIIMIMLGGRGGRGGRGGSGLLWWLLLLMHSSGRGRGGGWSGGGFGGGGGGFGGFGGGRSGGGGAGGGW